LCIKKGIGLLGFDLQLLKLRSNFFGCIGQFGAGGIMPASGHHLSVLLFVYHAATFEYPCQDEQLFYGILHLCAGLIVG
jgi:hypothetical protein